MTDALFISIVLGQGPVTGRGMDGLGSPIALPRDWGPLDWGVLGAYFALLVGSGVWVARRRVSSDQDYFLAGRAMPAWAVAVSLLGTAQSAATFIGGPQFSYRGDLSYLLTFAGGLLSAFIIARVFIPAYYRHGVWTPYELLERRFGRSARVATSWAYLVGRVFSNGARVFMGALPASLIMFGDAEPRHVLAGVAVMTAVSIVYTLAGGVRSAIWTDLIQCLVYLGAAVVAIVYLLRVIEAPVGAVFSTLLAPGDEGSKLIVIHMGLDFSKPWLGFDPTQEFTLLTAATGFSLLFLAAFGTDQDLVQRALTCREPGQAGRSVILSMLLQAPATLLFLAIGSLLWVFYRRPDLTGAAHTPGPDHTIFLDFILAHMPHGLAGLMFAGLFAAGLSSVNAMSSTFVNDCYKQLRPGRSERHYLSAGRWGVVAFGVILGVFAGACVFWYDPKKDTLVGFALNVMQFAYAGLLGVFLTALFTRRGNSASAIASLATGFVVVVVLQPPVWAWLTSLSEATAANPDDQAFTLGDLRLAFPWRLVIGTVLATLVCCAGRPPANADTRGEP